MSEMEVSSSGASIGQRFVLKFRSRVSAVPRGFWDLPVLLRDLENSISRQAVAEASVDASDSVPGDREPHRPENPRRESATVHHHAEGLFKQIDETRLSGACFIQQVVPQVGSGTGNRALPPEKPEIALVAHDRLLALLYGAIEE